MEDIKGFQGKFRFLSNFWYVPHKVWGYRTNEHFFQAMKSKDLDYRAMVKALSRPDQAKKAGKEVKLREDWKDIHLDVMLEGLRKKFAEGTNLAAQLLGTGDAYLEETNHWKDTYWGVCNGVGQNRLGHLLMQVRGELGGLGVVEEVKDD